MKFLILSLLYLFSVTILKAQDQQEYLGATTDQVQNWRALSQVFEDFNIEKGQQDSIASFEIMFISRSGAHTIHNSINYGKLKEISNCFMQEHQVAGFGSTTSNLFSLMIQ